MHQKKVTRSFCDHCGREFKTPKPCRKHELHCWKNPDRTPFLGELSSVTALGKVENFGNGLGADWRCDPWLEFVYHEDEGRPMPAWWPGEGKIWDGEVWQDVPFYESAPITGAHGCAGGAGPEDHWPVINTGSCDPDDWEIPDWEPLNKIEARRRLEWLAKPDLEIRPWQPPPKKTRGPFWSEIFGMSDGHWLSPAARRALG